MRTHPLIRVSAACVALVISTLACAAEIHLPREERASAWFAPTLVTNNQSLCAAALEAERDTFFNPIDQDPPIPGLTSLMVTEDAVVEDPDVVVLEKHAIELQLTLPDGSRTFLHFLRYPGCGGACEGGAVAIDSERIVAEPFEALPQVVPRTARYGPNRWRLFKSSEGDFYLRGTVDDHAQWYRVAAADRFELACDIALKPDTRGGKAAVYSQEVFDAVESLRVAAGRMAGGAGNCGSIGTPWRWSQYREEALETALYRPWSVVERHPGYRSENSSGDYARIAVQLELWSLGGLMEYRDFVAYQAQLARTLAVVTKFYREKFGWPAARAEETAEAALKGAISRGFGFHAYEPFPGPGERELRRAILSRAPIEQLRKLEIDASAIDREGEDSVLNIAIEYPEALGYLLEQGFDPNRGNAFGKTPLMYAAQYNQVAAAERLLQAGADPNATTLVPEDTCVYTISTSRLTPLHYAVRYSSTRLVKLLLDHGAVTFIQSVRDDGAEYPLQTLQRYSGVGAKEERNPHITESELTALVQLLVVPPDEQKLAMATDLVARARSEYARGDARQAYQHLQLALLAQPDRPDALADLPLIALRAGYVRAAVAAAGRATRVLKDSGALAASWFNKGLICEYPEARDLYLAEGPGCEMDVVEPFVKSWKIQPSPARANKLRALLLKRSASCIAADQHRQYSMYPLSFNAFRVYALHRPGDKIDPAMVRWSKHPALPTRAKVVDTLDLGGEVVTLLDVPHEPGSSGSIARKVEISIENLDCGVVQL